MAEIIKTWPLAVAAKTTARIFHPTASRFDTCYFTLGRGRPQKSIERLWFTYQGRIIGSFKVLEVWRNDGSLPPLRRLDGGSSAWQLKPDVWVAICQAPCTRITERLYMTGFRGWRYFDVDSYRGSPESRLRG